MNKTGIEWCDDTWNPIVGCTPVSEGCAGCYAKGQAKRNRKRCAACRTFKPHLHPERLDQPLRRKKPSVIFPCSMSDLFHDDVRPEWWVKIFGVMAKAAWHTFPILTKRPERMWRCLEDFKPMPHVYLGISAENQTRLDERMPHLMKLAAAGWKTFVSLEPFLGPINLRGCVGGVILGGETGPGARPMHPEWVRKVRDQCAEAGVPFFFKQWGEYIPVGPYQYGMNVGKQFVAIAADGRTWWPGESALAVGNPPPGSWTMKCVHRAKAGRVLDGRTHDELPWSPGLAAFRARGRKTL